MTRTDLTNGKVKSIRNFWVTQSSMDPGAFAVSEFPTRKQARYNMKINKKCQWFKSVHMYRVTEVSFGDGTIFTTKKRAR